MPTEIGLLDGTKFKIDEDVDAAVDLIGDPVPRWVYIAQRYFNPANVAYVVAVEDKSGSAFL